MGLASYGPWPASFCSLGLRTVFTFVKDCFVFFKKKKVNTKEHVTETVMWPGSIKYLPTGPLQKKFANLLQYTVSHRLKENCV